jgi:putative peptide zinc metalloprotease protein
MNSASSSAVIAPGSIDRQVLAGLRQDLELISGPVTPGIGQTWRIRDPARNRFFEIGPFEFAVLSSWSEGSNLATLAQRVSELLKTSVQPSELIEIVQFLLTNELLSTSSASVRDELNRRARTQRVGWLQWLLHNYLFVRIPLLDPGVMLTWLAGKTQWLFTWKTLVAAAILLLVDLHLISERWPEVVHNVDYSFSPEGIALLAVASIFSKAFHELGHALVAHRLGVRVPTIGVAIVVMYPMLYTDTGDSWRLTSKHKRLAIAAAGMVADLLLALIAVLAWSFFPDGPTRNALFFLAFVSSFIALGLNAMPFMRFDGYYVLSDALDLPNLHERASALALRWLRHQLWGLRSPDPEQQMSFGMRNFLVCFAIVTWIYRLVLYLTIAWLIFDYFFRALGIVLMVVEIGWFVVRPIYQEITYLSNRRTALKPRVMGLLIALLVPLAMAWLWLLSSGVNSPALARARAEFSIKAPSAGLLVAIKARDGQRLDIGDEVAVLIAHESTLRSDVAQITQQALLRDLQSTVVSEDSRDRIGPIRQRISGTQAMEQLSLSEQDLMLLKAPGSGLVRDLLPSAVAGRWVQAREPLMRIVSHEDTVVYAYIDEKHIHNVQIGAPAIFYPDDPGIAPIRGKVGAVDQSALRTLPSALLASIYKGPIAATQGPTGELTTNEVRYRVRIETDNPVTIPRVLRGSVYIEGDALSALTALPARIASAVMRELGI